jgi:hypothetical protein
MQMGIHITVVVGNVKTYDCMLVMLGMLGMLVMLVMLGMLAKGWGY